MSVEVAVFFTNANQLWRLRIRSSPLGPFKRFDEMIELMPRLLKRFPDLKYLIVGEGDDRPRLEAKVGGYGVAKQVLFLPA